MRSSFSRRTAWDLEETAYAQAVRQARNSGDSLFDLTLSNPTTSGFTYAGELLAPLVNPQALAYDPDPRGMPAARQAVAAYYAGHGARVAPESVLLTTSTSEGYSFLFRLLCDPGDEVLIARPSYPLFDFLATLDDVRLQPYPLYFDHGWWIDFAELEKRLSPRTRAIVVVHPNNPTGHWTSAGERGRIEQLCVAHGLALIVDEVFLDYALDRSLPRTFAAAPHPALTFCLSGLSKVAALPQMKAAWITVFGPHAPKLEALARLEVIADTFLSMNAPVQLALPAWLAMREPIQAQILERARENLAVLQMAAAQHPGQLRVLTPEAGWSAVVSLPGCGGSEHCAQRLAQQHRVIVHPGAFYGMGEPNRAVISLLTPSASFAEGIRRIVEGPL